MTNNTKNISCPYCSKPLSEKSFELVWKCEHCFQSLLYEKYLEWKKEKKRGLTKKDKNG